MEKLYIHSSQIDGKGVFAAKDIVEGESIEACPVLIISKVNLVHIDKTILYHYYFRWGRDQGAIALGYGSLYNHSYEPNARYEKNESKKIIIFTAIKKIQAGEEITVNYNGNPSLTDTLWFDAK